MNSTAETKAPLEDLMAAMDVVDTLRHQRDIAERELDGEGRRERLLQRLKELYSAQGIEVPERVLQEGIDALEQERFQYQSTTPSWRTKLAHIWVSRSRWGKPFGFLAVIGSLFSGFYVVNDVLPERQLRQELPVSISASFNNIEETAKNPEVLEQARFQLNNADLAIADNDFERAQKIYSSLRDIESRLRQYYSIRVVSRAGEDSGVWRIPDVNTSSRNYYLIVEAVDRNNAVVELEILNEETNRRTRTKIWGIRVNEETFFKVAADKKDDGIIQQNQIGEKLVGYLQPKFSIPTTGGTITEWRQSR